jgi:flagellar basal-body rod protein FlgF
MENTGYVALSSQTALFRRMDMIANNLANMNTIGYKKTAPVFTDYLSRSSSDERLTGDRLHYVIDYGQARDLSAGPLTMTDNPLDIAIKGPGFFVVDTPEGERYTRSGHFKLDDAGMIVDAGGQAVMTVDGAPLFIAADETVIAIEKDGSVSTENGEIGRIRVVDFADPQALQNTHSNYFMAAEDNPPQDLAIADLAQGFLESSNVDPLVEITAMINVQRTYEATMRLIEAEGTRQSNTIQAFTGQPS